MKDKMINACHVEGLLYEHKLEKKVTGENSKNPGTTYITGTIDIATDDKCVNIVPIHYTYVTEKTAKGNTNATYGVLNNIIEGNIKTVMGAGQDAAAKVRADSALGLNEFFSDRSGSEELVSVKRNEGGFVHTTDTIADDEKVRNKFDMDMIICNVVRQEADEERNIPEKAIIKGFVFDFRKALLPVEFSATNPNAMNYFEDLNASPSEPVFTKIWGRQISETIVREIREESAFGDDSVREIRSNRKDWIITGAARDQYVWDDESSITVDEFKKALADRETAIATIKQRQDEWKASQNAANGPKAGEFNF
jgi:hypothetical protein